ncbi:MAG TPA: ABC transporter substrate-binding protein [Herpetosiphonaceae bacterium]
MRDPLATARAALAQSDRDTAYQELAQALRQNPANGEAWYLMAQVIRDPSQRQDCLTRAEALGYVAPSLPGLPTVPLTALEPEPPAPAWQPSAAAERIAENRLAQTHDWSAPIDRALYDQPAGWAGAPRPPRRLEIGKLLAGLGALLLIVGIVSSFVPQFRPVVRQSVDPRTLQRIGGDGNFFLTLGDDPLSLDPALEESSPLLSRQLFSGLVKLDSDLQVVPDLAESYEVSEDQRTYTFKLRAPARFSSGRELTAEDVRWSLERATDPATGHINAAAYLDDIDGASEKIAGKAERLTGLEVIDEQTIAITLHEPSTVFLAKLTFPTAAVLDRRSIEADPEGWTEKPVSSGPFQLDYWDHRKRMELIPNEHYPGQPAKLGRLTFLIGAEGANPLGLYETGVIDMAGVSGYSLDRINDPSDPLHAELQSSVSLSTSYIAFNVRQAPFDDPKVREAFSLLIDHRKLADVSYNGTALIARGLLPPDLPGANPEALPEPRYDIERAKQLLTESSYGGADKLPKIVAMGGGNVGLLAQIAKEQLGIEIEVRSVDGRTKPYIEALEEGQFQLYDFGWTADFPDPQNFIQVLFGTGAYYNYGGYSNPKVDDLVNKAKGEGDPDKRAALYQQAERQLMDDHALVPIVHGTSHRLVKPYVDGLVVTPQGLLDLAGVSLRR